MWPKHSESRQALTCNDQVKDFGHYVKSKGKPCIVNDPSGYHAVNGLEGRGEVLRGQPGGTAVVQESNINVLPNQNIGDAAHTKENSIQLELPALLRGGKEVYTVPQTRAMGLGDRDF